MLKIYFNEKSDANAHIKLTIKDLCITAEVKSSDKQAYGYDVIETLRPYNSYSLCSAVGKVKNYRKVSKSDYKFLDLNRLGVSVRLDFAELSQLYSTDNVLQIDTGVIGGDERDVIIRIFQGSELETEIEADEPYEILSFNSDDLVTGDHPRMHLWDSYALEVDGNVLMADRRGIPRCDDFIPTVVLKAGEEYIDFKITKYKGAFEGGTLSRDIDDESVTVESTCGLVNNRRVELENGEGYFRLYPFGHIGAFKIKLGRKWYEVWNEYNLILEEEDAGDDLSGEQV